MLVAEVPVSCDFYPFQVLSSNQCVAWVGRGGGGADGNGKA